MKYSRYPKEEVPVEQGPVVTITLIADGTIDIVLNKPVQARHSWEWVHLQIARAALDLQAIQMNQRLGNA